jgi:hypothetical protein
MPEYLQRESNVITIANFYEAFQLKKYNFEPDYQRKSIWTEEKQSFLINSIVKNFPIPPIFLHQQIDDDTGKTKYDVIDGKQRLSAIIAFLENKIVISDEEEESDIAGLYFKDLDNDPYTEIKKRIWRYSLSIEYVDTGDQNVIDSIFDRLNRNGEPLTGQELRNANYYDTDFLKAVEKNADNPFWKERLEVVDKARMEDIEFISELFFFIAEGKEQTAFPKEMDALYDKYAPNGSLNLNDIQIKFNAITNFMSNLNLNYQLYRIRGISHLYGLFAFSAYCVEKKVALDDVSTELNSFYVELRDKNLDDENIVQYKNSMSARTKSDYQRRKRKEALINFCNI